MAAKQLEVIEWLSDFYGPKKNIEFEKNEENINILHRLLTDYKEALKDLNSVNSYIKNNLDEYKNTGEIFKHINNEMGLQSEHLFDSDDNKCLEALSSLYCNLKLESISSSNIMLAIQSLENKNSEEEESFDDEKQLSAKLLEFSENLDKDLKELNKICDDAESVRTDQDYELLKEAKRSDFYKEKIKKYQSDSRSYETKLAEAGFVDEISLSSTSENIKKLSCEEKELQEKTALLESYTLPPDIVLAELKVEELRLKLSETMKSIATSYSTRN